MSLGICFWPLRKMLTLKTGTKNTQVSQHQTVIIWRTMSLESKIYQGTKTPHTTPGYPATLWFNSSMHLTAESSDTPSPHFLPPLGHSMLLPWLHHSINRTAHRLVPHQPRHLPPPEKRGLKHMTRKGGFSQISSLSYLPQKAALAQPKVQLWQFKMIYISATAFSLLSFPPAMHSHPLSCASTGICLTQQRASSGSYASRKLFHFLQKMMFFC